MRLLLALFALLVPLTVAAATPDWTRTVTRAPNGAYVMGNPKAKVRLVEYLSYSCPHCAHFIGEAAGPLKAEFVSKGTVSVEIRNSMHDRYDFTAALLARCGGAARFFGNTEALFGAQEALITKAIAFEASNTLPEGAPINDALKALAKGAGLIDFMVARGFTPAQLDTCLTDKAAQETVIALTNESQARNIPGTPAFLLNGTLVTVAGWGPVGSQIRAAVAQR